MTDNAWIYITNRSMRDLLGQKGIRHLRRRPYRPQTNGKVERFQETMAREWAYEMTYSCARALALAHEYWRRHDDESRPHSALGGRSPISRVRNVCRQDIQGHTFGWA